MGNARDKMELLGAQGKSLGTFDLLVDASGVAATLRHNRFSSKADAFYTGTTFLQGVVYSPEASWPAEVVKQLGEGTVGFVGPSKDGKAYVEAFAQRYGAAPEDQMANITSRVVTEGPGDLAKNLEMEGVHGFTNKKEDVEKVRSFYMDSLAHPEWPKMYKDALNNIDGARILPIFMHPLAEKVKKETIEGTDDIPLIGIGDSLHALPPWSGMSGNYALMDAADLATALIAEHDKKEEGRSCWSSNSLATMLREKEQRFMERTDKRRDHAIRIGKYTREYMSSTPIRDFDWISGQVIARPFSWTDPEAVCVSGYLRT